MTIKSAFFVSTRHFWGKKGKKKLSSHLKGSILGIGLSLIPLIVGLELTNGMIEGITKRFIELESFHFQLINSFGVNRQESVRLESALKTLPSVTEVIPNNQGQGLAYSPSDRIGVAIRGLPPDLYARDAQFRKYLIMKAGRYDLGKGKVLVSLGVAEKLNLKLGDPLKVLTAKKRAGKLPILRPNSFTVAGIFSTGYHDLDAYTVYIPYEQGLTLFQDPRSQNLGVKIKDPFGPLAKIERQIENLLPNGWSLRSWQQSSESMYNTFKTTKGLLLFIMVLIVGVASVNISSALVMLIIERRQEIAILKSTGASPFGISFSFMLTGFITGFLGALIGVSLGLLLAVNINAVVSLLEFLINGGLSFIKTVLHPLIAFQTERVDILSAAYYLEEIPIRLDWWEIVSIAMVTIFFSTCSAYLPARKAAKIRPVDVLRKH